MSKHSDDAKELFKQGYNCAQAVVVAFCDETGLGREEALRLSSSFGAGMGRLREVCGAVSGIFMVAGMKYGPADPTDQPKKAEHYKLVQFLAKRFEESNGSIVCRDLLNLAVKHDNPVPAERTETYYKKRPCAELVEFAAQIMDNYIEMKKTEESK